MQDLSIAGDFMKVILKAEHASEDELKSARGMLIGILNKVGAKIFVTTAADILKNNFRIEGCNDVRMPLKRIFSISLPELEEDLAGQKYNLPNGHPLSMLSNDHKENIEKLKMLSHSLSAIDKDVSLEKIKNTLKEAQDYYTELDTHIRKEEEVLFPALEASGMQEHPQNLRDEHKNFRDLLFKITGILKNTPKQPGTLEIGEIKKSKDKFIADISNHIFRETYIFYPAALEFIVDKNEWQKIEESFNRIK